MARISVATPLLLGSASPRRREMLAGVGFPIAVRPPQVDEAFGPGEAPTAYLERVSSAKLSEITRLGAAEGLAFAATLVADTIVTLDGAMVDKPATPDDARAALRTLAAKTHEVSTRFVVGSHDGGVLHAETVTTRVTFRALEGAEIEAYVASREGLDKAGGYGIQGLAAGFVSRIEGSYTTVVGLPLAEVVVALRRLSLWP